MKPSEVCELEEINYGVHSCNRKMLNGKWGEDCVVAYTKARLGSIFIIKIQGGYAGFYYINKELKNYELFGFHVKRITLKDAVTIMGFDDCVIVNEEEYSRVKKQLVLDGLNI
jgi:homoserine trans-succinylase